MIRIALTLLLCMIALAGCNDVPAPSAPDILSQKITPAGKMPITVLVKYAFSINAFEAEVEKRFPSIDLVQVGNYTRDRGIVEYQRRIEHDDLPDIVMTWPLNVGEKYWASRLIDLSTMPFSSRYNTSMLNDIARDGKLYYLPGPAQVRGIVYNKTLFEERGWKAPRNFDEFVALCKQIEDSGMRSIQLGFENAEVLDTAFIGFSYGNAFATPADAQWLNDYNNGQGSLEKLRPALQHFVAMTKAGIWKKQDLHVGYASRERMLFTRHCAMSEDSVLLTRMGRSMTGTLDTFALMPFFSPGEQQDWARLYMVCYIGLNKHLTEPQNKDKYNLVLQLMEYISSPEGQTMLAADTGAMFSSLKGTTAPAIPEIADLRDTLGQGRSVIFPQLDRASEAFRNGLAGLLDNTSTVDDVIRLTDAQNASPPALAAPEVLGEATQDFTILETGNFVTDAMRQHAKTDIALFLDNGKDGRFNGKGISARLYKGPQTIQDVERILPDLKRNERGSLLTVTMTGADLLHTLEHAIAVDNGERGWFYYFSGLRMTFSPAAPPGTRIRAVTDAEENPIEPSTVYSIAIMDDSVPFEAVRSVQASGVLVRDMLATTIQTRKTIAPSGDGRFVIAEPSPNIKHFRLGKQEEFISPVK